MTLNLNRLKAERITGGFTQETMAKALGMSLSSYRRRETGETNLDANELARIANILNIKDISVFFSKTFDK